MKELILYYLVKLFGAFVRLLPIGPALSLGKLIGMCAYYFDTRHKSIVYSNFKMAFARIKSPGDIRVMTKKVFKNYGQNLIELLRLPLIDVNNVEDFLTIEGKENVTNSLKKGKGVILLAMHFGSWEIASSSCAMLGLPYKVFVNPQKKYSKLDELLNSYRTFGGSTILSRGAGTKDFIKCLQNNEVVGMVVDQGGKEGMLIPFFGRKASMSVGAIRMGLKKDVPICFAIIIREGGNQHRMIISKPLDLINTGDLEKDTYTNLKRVVNIMEDYIIKHPSEYMWFYKIWKYSNQAHVTILNDGKTGHLRQSQTVAKLTQEALTERKIEHSCEIVDIHFRNKFLEKVFSLLSLMIHPFLFIGRLGILKWVLTPKSFQQMMSVKSDFIISTGTRMAGVNYLLSKDQKAKSVVILKPGHLSYQKFDLVILPQHDVTEKEKQLERVAVTHAAPNLVSDQYMQEQAALLRNRFSHLKSRSRLTIGLFIGGNSKNVFLGDRQIRTLINQLKEALRELNADLVGTTSRRTPARIEKVLQREFKSHPQCPLWITAKSQDVPEAVGGILGISDIVIVSGDSISMVSEAASSGKYTVVFTPEKKDVLLRTSNKHLQFIEQLNNQGFILSTNVVDIAQSIYGIAKNKIKTKKIDDNQIIKEALRYVI